MGRTLAPRMHPEEIARAKHAKLCACGLSRRKAEYLADLAHRFVDGSLHAAAWERMDDEAVIEEGETTCCYAHSEKSWIDDPQGVQWETFLTTGESTEYGTDEIRPKSGKVSGSACCAPSCCTQSPA